MNQKVIDPSEPNTEKFEAVLDGNQAAQPLLPEQIEKWIRKELELTQGRVRELADERDRLFEKLVVAEALVAQLAAVAQDESDKRLAALVLSGALAAANYETHRARSVNDNRRRIAVMRQVAEETAGQAQPSRTAQRRD